MGSRGCNKPRSETGNDDTKREMGYQTPLSAEKWGFEDVLMKGKPLTLAQPLGSYVIENVLFKIAYPAEFHAQTAAEAAVMLHDAVKIV